MSELEVMADDGGEVEVSPDYMAELKAMADEIRRDCSDGVYALRQTYEDARLCRWSGQSDDGRKRKAALQKDPTPFEGASDNRVRLIDQITNEQRAELVTAAMRATPRAMGMEGTDEKKAGKIGTVLKWLMKNQWGSGYRRTLKLLANYMLADSPGGAVMGIFWNEERCLESKLVTRDSLVQEYAATLQLLGVEITEEGLQAAAAIMEDPARRDEVKEIIRAMLPHLKAKRVNELARKLNEDGEAYIPVPMTKPGMPVVTALRLFDDVFFPTNTTSIQTARGVHMREWLTRVQVLERAATEGWSSDFVNELIGEDGQNGQNGHSGPRGQEGKSAFPEEDGASGATTATVLERTGLYELLTTFVPTANEDGVPGVQVYKWNYYCEKAARPRELLPYKHGKLPFVYFAREALTARLTDSRGLAEILLTEQSGMKLLADSVEDNVQISVLPPMLVPKRGTARYDRVWEPLGQIATEPRDRFEPMKTPQYPVSADKHREDVLRRVNEYHGRKAPNVDPEIAMILRQERVDDYLASLSDGLMQVVQLCQQFMSPEQLQRIMGGAMEEIPADTAEIQGKFDIHLSFDVRDLDMEYVTKKAEIAQKFIMPADRQATTRWDRHVQRLWESIDPVLAEEMVAPPEEASAREKADEESKFVKMLNGIRPDRPEKGDNFALRLQIFEGLLQERMGNEGAFPPISPAARVLLGEHMDYLTFQAQQLENAQTGRRGFEEEDLGDPETTGTGGMGNGPFGGAQDGQNGQNGMRAGA